MIRFVAFMGSIDDAGEVNDENVEGESVDSREGGGRCSSCDNHCTTCKVSTSTSQESQFSPEAVFVNIMTDRLQSALRRRDAKLRRKLRNQEEVSTKILS